MKKSAYLSLLGFIVLCLFVEIVGGLFTYSSVRDWYPTLMKPSWTPPGFVFGPVWSLLYFLMGVGAWFVYKSRHSHLRTWALSLFFIQLALNFFWSILFFGLKNPLLGFIDAILLSIAVLLTTIVFFRVSKVAGWCFLPYLLWLLYATVLNGVIWWVNC